uniref:Uncharacterized protein n=1 Tax=Arundo donax TaxID=35708 RepID=A0A0A9BDZ4_ARUDO
MSGRLHQREQFQGQGERMKLPICML